MPGTTLTGTYQSGITLTSATTTIAAGARITSSGTAVSTPRAASNAYTVITGGYINGSLYGIDLGAGGSVTNLSGGTIVGQSGGVTIAGVSGTVVNAGSIVGGSYGVYLHNGGTIANQSGATIAGYSAIVVAYGSGSVTNAGSVLGGNFGLELLTGGSVTNQAAGLLSGGHTGLRITFGAGTVQNAGRIAGSGIYGVELELGGTVTNLAGATISGASVGLHIANAAATVVNAGTIAGGTYAVQLYSSYANRLIVDPGAVFNGVVTGSNATSAASISTLELAPGTQTGTLSGLGTKYTGFQQVVNDSGASWMLAGANTVASQYYLSNLGALTNSGTLFDNGSVGNSSYLGGSGTIALGADALLTNRGTIAMTEHLLLGSAYERLALSPTNPNGVVDNFSYGHTIGVIGFTAASIATLTGNTAVVLTNAANARTTIDFGAAISGATFTATPLGTDLIALCFRAGTLIETPNGPVSVQSLRPGDLVTTAHNGARPIVWIGRRTVRCSHHPHPEKVWPIRVRAGTFDNGLPARDLFLSPDHALFADDVLIPVKHLVNGDSVAQVPVDTVEYYHVELPTHDILLAEGLPAESFLDTGCRCHFDNGGPMVTLHPDFGAATWEAFGYAPLIVTGPRVEALRRRLRDKDGISSGLSRVGAKIGWSE